MSDPLATLDPAVLGLLEEIAGQGGVSALRGRLASLSAALSPDARVSSFSSLMSKAERQLVTFHREETAFLLRSAALWVLYSDRKSQGCLFPHSRAICRRDMVVPEHYRHRLEAIRKAVATIPPASKGIDLALQAFSADAPSPTLAAWIAGYSLLLVPSDTARMYVAYALLRQGVPLMTRTILEGVVQRGASAELTSYAWDNLGFLEQCMDRLPQCARAYQRSSVADRSRVQPPLQRLVILLRLGWPNELERAAREVDELDARAEHALEWFLSPANVVLRYRAAQHTPVERTRMLSMSARFGPISSRIIESYASAASA